MKINQKGFIAVISIILLVMIIGAIRYFALSKKQTPLEINQSSIIDGRKILFVALKVDAPFSTATVTIQSDNSVLYMAKQRGQNEIQDSATLTSLQMNELAKVLQETDLLNMKNRPAGNDDPQDGSTYTITITVLPNGPPELTYPGVHSVSCYQLRCDRSFLKLKDTIIELWGRDVLEVGV